MFRPTRPNQFYGSERNPGGELPFERSATHLGNVSTCFEPQNVLATRHTVLISERLTAKRDSNE